MIDIWVNVTNGLLKRSSNLIREFKPTGVVDIARLVIANRQIRAIMVGAR